MKLSILIASFLALSFAPAAGILADEETVSFRKDIAPILLKNCVACHGPKKAEGGYRVDSYERTMEPGDSGGDPFWPEDTEYSEAFRRITSEDEFERMPLEADPLPEHEIALFRRWVQQGAEYDGDDPAAELVTIIPPPKHPEAPKAYPYPVPVATLAFGAEGEELYVGGYHELTVWNPANGELVRRVPNVGQRSYGMSLSPDGNLLAVGCGAPGRLGETRLFDPSSGELESVLGSTSDVVLDVAFTGQGDRLAVGSADGLIRIFEVSSGEQVRTITSHSDWVTAVAWNRDATKLASASRDKTAKVFDVESGELLVTYSGHNEPVKGVAFHPDGKQVYSSGGDKKLHLWNVEDAKKAADVGFGGEVFKLWSSDELLLAPSADKTVRQFDAETHEQVRSYSGHEDWALSVAYDPHSKRLAAGGFDGQVRIWNTEDGSLVTSFVAAPGYTPKQ